MTRYLTRTWFGSAARRGSFSNISGHDVGEVRWRENESTPSYSLKSYDGNADAATCKCIEVVWPRGPTIGWFRQMDLWLNQVSAAPGSSPEVNQVLRAGIHAYAKSSRWLKTRFTR